MRLQHTSPGSTTPQYHSQGITPSARTASPRLSWPDAVAYREAIQTPQVSLTDPLLNTAEVVTDKRGLPMAYTGRFAVVFKMKTANGETYALRCFTAPDTAYAKTDDAFALPSSHRYRILQKYVEEDRSIFVPFRYVDDGIRVGGEFYPVLSMRWATGEPLGRWVEKHLHEPTALRALCASLTALLARLEEKSISHGDWQHDNILVSEDGWHVTLVDYDGMYVPEFEGMLAPELGHANYQHPARTVEHFGPGLDRFACLSIQTSLLALAQDPTLWARFSDGESLLFKQRDYADVENSPAFEAVKAVAVLAQDEILADAVVRLEDACRAGAMSTLLPLHVEAGVRPSPATVYEPIKVAPLPPRPAPKTGGQSVGQVPIQRWWMAGEAVVPPATPTVQTNPVSPHGQTANTGQPVSRASLLAAAAGATNTSLASLTAKQANRPRVSVSGPQNQPYAFLNRLQSPEAAKNEQKHLWRWRAGGLAMINFVVLLIWAAIATRNPILPVYFAWLLNYAGLGYSRWPRKAIYEDLVTQIAKMEELIAARNKRIVEVGGVPGANANAGALPLHEFVEERLKDTSINGILTVTSMLSTTLRILRHAGIENASDLRNQIHSLHITPYQMAALQNWLKEKETEAETQWRRLIGSTPVEVARLQNEIAEFERHAAHLKRERDQYPDSSYQTYLSLLLGLNQSPQTGNPKPGTP